MSTIIAVDQEVRWPNMDTSSVQLWRDGSRVQMLVKDLKGVVHNLFTTAGGFRFEE